MGEFDDLPTPETFHHQIDAAHRQGAEFVRREFGPLFFEMATRLRDLEPSGGFEVKTTERERYGLFGTRERERMTSVVHRGWPLGYIDGNSDYPSMAYLLPDGSVYPSIELGIEALLAGERHLWTGPDLRARLIQRLKIKYFEWLIR